MTHFPKPLWNSRWNEMGHGTEEEEEITNGK
jgi:hypothetical protein